MLHELIDLVKVMKSRFGRLLRPLAWKRNGPILEDVDKSGTKCIK